MKVLCDIIVPSYVPISENEIYPLNCLRSIQFYTKPGTYRIIWVNNGSKYFEKTEAMLADFNHITIKLPENIGFVGATNKGLEVSDAKYVCLLNNDTVVSEHWLEKLINALKRNPKLGIVGPVTAPSGVLKNYDSHHSVQHINDFANRKVFPKYKTLQDFNKKIEKKYPGHLAEISLVAFLCAVIRREVIDKIGLLDAGYGMGMYDDNDYNLATRKAGWETKLLYDTCIIHFGRATFNVMEQVEHFDVNGLIQRSKVYMDKKWANK